MKDAQKVIGFKRGLDPSKIQSVLITITPQMAKVVNIMLETGMYGTSARVILHRLLEDSLRQEADKLEIPIYKNK